MQLVFRSFNRNTYLLLLIYVLVGTAFVYLRPIHVDEGYNIRIAQNILNGNLLYVDILYNHPPLLPYFYSILSGFGFASYIILRYISLILTFTLIILVYFHVHKFTQDKASANFAVFLIIFNGLFIDWSSIIKMFPLANLFFYSAFLCTSLIIFDYSKKYLRLCFLIGLFAGLSVNLRMTYSVPALIVFIMLAHFFYKSKLPLSSSFLYLLSFVFGFLISSLPAIYYLIYYPDYFTYGVFRHNFEAQQVQWESESNILLWFKFFFLPQNFILIILVLLSLKYKFRTKGFTFLVIISLLASNSAGYFVNLYFMVIIPFAAFAAGMNYYNLKQTLTVRSKPVINHVMTIYVASIFLGIPHIKHLIFGDSLDPNPLQLKEIIDYERSLPGTTILSSWDAYSIFSGKRNLLKNELVYACTVEKVSKEETRKFSLPESEKIDSLITNKFVDVIILHESFPVALLVHEQLIKSIYKLNKTFGNIQIYTKD